MMFASKTFVKAGTKRKRSVSGAENATSTAGRVAPPRATRGTVPRGRFKRQKSESILGSSSDDDLDERLSVSTGTTDTRSGEEDEEVDLIGTDSDDDNEESGEDAETVGSAMEVDVDDVDAQGFWDGADSENDSAAGDSCESERFLCLPSPCYVMLIYFTSLQFPPFSTMGAWISQRMNTTSMTRAQESSSGYGKTRSSGCTHAPAFQTTLTR